MHRVGITASRNGPTYGQLLTLVTLLSSSKILAECFSAYDESWFHHGDCVGGDEVSHDVAKMLGYKTSVHPPTDSRLRANKRGTISHPPKPYIERNHDIADVVSELFVLPDTMYERIRSGTWATWRYYSSNYDRHWAIIWPDGTYLRGKGRSGTDEVRKLSKLGPNS
jgi:hypothetical protein